MSVNGYQWMLALGLMLMAGGVRLQAQEEGYRFTRTQVVVDRPEHWQAWEGAIGAYRIGADGRVEPRFLRRDLNAVRNAGEFETIVAGGDTVVGGLRQAGSREETAAQVMDGEMDTYWEPDREDPLENWFVEIDLGRAVIARRVRVRFAEEGEGDPFLKFRVLLADGREIDFTERTRGLEFFRVGQVTWPNKEQRTFTFDVPLQRPAPEGVEGEVARIVRFEALSTDGSRGEEVSPEVYQILGDEDRGAVDYFRQTIAGRLIQVAETTYRTLPDEERGPVRYYRHERPRLAELEVYTLGDNIISLTQRLRNRESDLFDNPVLTLSTDGNYASLYPLRVYDRVQDRNQLEIDLGARYWLERVRLLTSQDPLTAYQVRVADGSLDPSGARIWKALDERLNQEGFLQLEERFPLQEVRYIELRRLELVGAREETGSLSEIQAYGEGYVSEVVLTSPLLRLEGSRMFTTVEWEGEAIKGTELEIRTRSGDDLHRIEQYFDRFGREISKEQWESMAARNRGEAIIQELPGSRWSNWSEIYLKSGVPFKSPSPRRMAMVQVRLLTRDPLRAASLRQLRLGLAPPLVDQVLAEIWPTQGVRPGVDQAFTLYLRPVFVPGDPGFDRLRIHSSSSAPVELLSLRAGSETALRANTARSLWPGEVEQRQLEDGGVELIFPEPVVRGNEVYVAHFRTRVFLSGTVFGAELTRATRPGVVQGAIEGDASTLVESQSLTVGAELKGTPLLDAVEVVPPVFTPNGDGVNDATQVRFSVFRLKGEHAFQVEIFDLAGRRMRDLSGVRERPSGRHAVSWDGRDQNGRRVEPGIYLARVGFGTDVGAEGTAAVRLIHLVY